MVVHASLLTAKEALLGIDDRIQEVSADTGSRHHEKDIFVSMIDMVRYDCISLLR